MSDQHGRGPERQRDRRRVNKIILSTLGVLVLAIAGGVAAISLASGSRPAAKAPADAAAPRGTPTSAAPAATEGTPGALKAWFDHGGKTALDNIAGDLTAMHRDWTAARRTGNATMGVVDCSDLAYAVTQATAAGPIPYAPSEQAFAKALAYFRAAAANCLTAASGGGASLFAKSAREVNLGNAWSLRAFKAMEGLVPGPPFAS